MNKRNGGWQMASDWRPKTPQIEIDDRKSVVIEGCRRICEYENEAVKINVGKYNVRVIRKALRIKNLADGWGRNDEQIETFEV